MSSEYQPPGVCLSKALPRLPSHIGPLDVSWAAGCLLLLPGIRRFPQHYVAYILNPSPDVLWLLPGDLPAEPNKVIASSSHPDLLGGWDTWAETALPGPASMPVPEGMTSIPTVRWSLETQVSPSLLRRGQGRARLQVRVRVRVCPSQPYVRVNHRVLCCLFHGSAHTL